jgi:hypothetical protein
VLSGVVRRLRGIATDVVGRIADVTRSARVEDVEYERRFDGDKKRVIVTFNIECPNRVAVPSVIGAVEAVRGVRRVVVQHQG